MSEKAERTEGINKLREMVKDIDFCMLTTIDESGDLHSRPMSTNGEIDFDGDLWFFTYASSHKMAEINRVSKVNASFSAPDKQRYVSMSGHAQIVRDRQKIEEMWKPELKAWFPKGTDEPDIALLKINVEKAEYWDNPSSMVSHAIGFISSVVTGRPANPGVNKQVNLE